MMEVQDLVNNVAAEIYHSYENPQDEYMYMICVLDFLLERP